jgi:hypothetical protein
MALVAANGTFNLGPASATATLNDSNALVDTVDTQIIYIVP